MLELREADLRYVCVRGSLLDLPTLIALEAGMRPGEVLGLGWQDVDLESGTARVRQTLQITMQFDTPKSHRSARSLTLPGFLVEALRSRKKIQNERRLVLGEAWQDLDLICERGDGSPLRPNTISKQFGAAMKAAGLNITFHGLRHTQHRSCSAPAPI